MNFKKEFLTDLIKGKLKGDFYPFNMGNLNDSEKYLKQIIGRISDISTIDVQAVLNHYGSGFSSYVHLFINKKNKEDVITLKNGNKTAEEINGLMIYLCRLCPNAVYSQGNWSNFYENDIRTGNSYPLILPEEIGNMPPFDWKEEMVRISNILNEYGYAFLVKEELNTYLDFEISIRTSVDPPYKVFDCFFYWDD